MLAANSNPLVRGFDASLDGAADDAAATRYTVITGERICGWSCDPSSPHYEKDHHMCPAHCGGGHVAADGGGDVGGGGGGGGGAHHRQ